MSKLPPRIDSSTSSTRVNPSSDEQARRDGAQIWGKTPPPTVPLQQLQQKRPAQATQKKQKLGKVGKLLSAAELEALAGVEGIDSTPFTGDDQTDYTPPAVRRAIERAYSPSESDTFEFCRPNGSQNDKAARQVFDNPDKFSQLMQHLPALIADKDPALAKRLRLLLEEEKTALDLVQGYKNALVFS